MTATPSGFSWPGRRRSRPAIAAVALAAAVSTIAVASVAANGHPSRCPNPFPGTSRACRFLLVWR